MRPLVELRLADLERGQAARSRIASIRSACCLTSWAVRRRGPPGSGGGSAAAGGERREGVLVERDRRARRRPAARTRAGRRRGSRRPTGRTPSPRAAPGRTARRGTAGRRRRRRRSARRIVVRSAPATLDARPALECGRSGPSPTKASRPSPSRSKAFARRRTFLRSISAPDAEEGRVGPSGGRARAREAVEVDAAVDDLGLARASGTFASSSRRR